MKGIIERSAATLEMMKKSAIFMALISEKSEEDVAQMIQLGQAVMMGKPIVLIIFDDAKVSDKLLRIADDHTRVSRNDRKKIEEETSRMLLKFVKAKA